MIDRKLHILLIFSILEIYKQLRYLFSMHNFDTIFSNFYDICNSFAGNLVNSLGNIPHCGVVSKFSDLEIIAQPEFGSLKH